jgi:hypothetical protein
MAVPQTIMKENCMKKKVKKVQDREICEFQTSLRLALIEGETDQELQARRDQLIDSYSFAELDPIWKDDKKLAEIFWDEMLDLCGYKRNQCFPTKAFWKLLDGYHVLTYTCLLDQNRI